MIYFIHLFIYFIQIWFTWPHWGMWYSRPKGEKGRRDGEGYRISQARERLSSLALMHNHYVKDINLRQVDLFAQKHSGGFSLAHYWKIKPKIHLELDIFLKYRCFYICSWLSDFLCNDLQNSRNADNLILQNFLREHASRPPGISRLRWSSVHALGAHMHLPTQKAPYGPGFACCHP